MGSCQSNQFIVISPDAAPKLSKITIKDSPTKLVSKQDPSIQNGMHRSAPAPSKCKFSSLNYSKNAKSTPRLRLRCMITNWIELETSWNPGFAAEPWRIMVVKVFHQKISLACLPRRGCVVSALTLCAKRALNTMDKLHEKKINKSLCIIELIVLIAVNSPKS